MELVGRIEEPRYQNSLRDISVSNIDIPAPPEGFISSELVVNVYDSNNIVPWGYINIEFMAEIYQEMVAAGQFADHLSYLESYSDVFNYFYEGINRGKIEPLVITSISGLNLTMCVIDTNNKPITPGKMSLTFNPISREGKFNQYTELQKLSFLAPNGEIFLRFNLTADTALFPDISERLIDILKRRQSIYS